jgi:hypothetical protein
MTLNVRRAAKCLGVTGRISLQQDIFSVRDLPPPRSLRDDLNFIRRNRCRPDRPTNLRVTSVGENSLGLSWVDNSDNEEGFRIKFRGRKLGSADHDGTEQVGGQLTSALLSDLNSGFRYRITVRAFNVAGESEQSNEVEAITPAVEEIRRVNLERQDIVQGNVPYLGEFPAPFGVVPPGRIRRIRVPQLGPVDLQVQFVKLGHSTTECGKPSAVVVLTEGQETIPQQLTEIFGVSEPQFDTQDHVFFVTCIGLSDSTTPLPNRIPIDITVLFDSPE